MSDDKERQTGEEISEQTSSETARADDASPEAESPARPSRRRRALRGSVIAFVILLMFCVFAAGLVWQAIGKPIEAPEWIRDKIEERLDASAPGLDVSVGRISLFLAPDLSPEIIIDNVSLVDSLTERPLVSLTRMDTALSRGDALVGRLQPKTISAAGLFLKLRRERDGSFDLQLGNGLGSTAPDLPALLTQLDQAFEAPALSGLRDIELEGVTLDYTDAQSGRAWVIDGGRIGATRSDDAIRLRGDFVLLSGGAEATAVTVNATSPVGAPEMEFGLTLDNMPAGDIATQSPALAWLGVLRAPISGALRSGFDAQGALLPLNATLQIGAGDVQPNEATRPIPFEGARAYFTYRAAEQSFEFSEVSVRSEWIDTSGSGTATLETDARGGLSGMTAQLALSGISANPFDIYDAPRSVDAASVDLHLALDPFVLRLGQARFTSGDLVLTAQGRVSADKEGWRGSAAARTDAASVGDILSYWPKVAIPNTRAWIDRNIPAGTFRDVDFALQFTPDAPNPTLYLGAGIEDATLRFIQKMPPITGLHGRLTLEDNRLVVVADRAKVAAARGGTITADGTVFELTDVRARPGNARVDLRTQSTITAALALIDSEPLKLMAQAGQPVDIAEGNAKLEGTLRFPIQQRITGNDVEFGIAGLITDADSTQIVPGRRIAAPSLDLEVSPERIEIAGKGTFDGIPFDGAWSSPLGGPRASRKGLVEAQVEISPKTLAALNINLPSGYVGGSGRGALTIDLPNVETPSFSLSTNLAGIGLNIAPIGWSMSRGATGRLAVSGALSNPVRIDRIVLDGPGLDATGRVVLRSGGGFERLEIDRLRVGGWLDAPVTLTGRGANAPLGVAVRGGRLDLRKSPLGRGSGGASQAAGGPINLALDELQITDTLRLTNMSGEFTSGGALEGDFTGRINGGARITGRARAQDNGTGFVIRAEDAGRAVKDAGLFRDLVDGSLTLRLRPTGQTGTFDGEATINQARLRNAPAVAELLNAISVIGLLTQLNGEGIYFDEIEAVFRLTPSRVILTRSSAVGPSMGISLDGYYDIARSVMDMQGVISPIYAINILGRAFARKGEGLIGFNFNMRGPARDPAVTVNPLSALTPGMFRDIFRRPPPVISE